LHDAGVTRIVFLDDFPFPTLGVGDAPFPVAESLRGGAISIGNFDGVHRGHQDLLRQLKRMAGELGGPAVAVVFDPQPAEILRPEAAPVRLTDLETRAQRMKPLGIDFLLVCRSTERLFSMTADQFFDQLIVDLLGAAGMVEGPNFFFGKDRLGDVRLLRQRCEQAAIRLQIADPLLDDSTPPAMISSSRIRAALSAGDVRAAGEMLGRPHRVSGTVVDGAKRGRVIGFPTANLESVVGMLPALGVYAAGVTLPDGGSHHAAVHLGPNPTFDRDAEGRTADEGTSASKMHPAKFEVHLLDYSGGLYGEVLKVDFVERIRDVRRFESVERLTEQLRRDVATVRRELNLSSTASS